MRPLVAFVVLLVLGAVACDSTSDPGPTTSSSTTTTTIVGDSCERVGGDTVRYLEELIDTLDETRLQELSDPAIWGQDLRDLQRAGKDLDLRIEALGCDPARIQQLAFAEADIVPGGPLSARLVELLLTPTTSTTTTTVVDSTIGSTTTSTAPSAGDG